MDVVPALHIILLHFIAMLLVAVSNGKSSTQPSHGRLPEKIAIAITL